MVVGIKSSEESLEKNIFSLHVDNCYLTFEHMQDLNIYHDYFKYNLLNMFYPTTVWYATVNPPFFWWILQLHTTLEITP